MTIVEAGYYSTGKYVEHLTYFYFDELSEKEKREILKNEYTSNDKNTSKQK